MAETLKITSDQETVRLKTINPYFQHIWDGDKTFEIRKNDRNFVAGQILRLSEYEGFGGFSGREIMVRIIYLLSSDEFPEGLKEGYCCMGIHVIDKF